MGNRVTCYTARASNIVPDDAPTLPTHRNFEKYFLPWVTLNLRRIQRLNTFFSSFTIKLYLMDRTNIYEEINSITYTTVKK